MRRRWDKDRANGPGAAGSEPDVGTCLRVRLDPHAHCHAAQGHVRSMRLAPQRLTPPHPSNPQSQNVPCAPL